MTGAEIRALARLIDRMDYYRLLRVGRDVPAPQIRAAYHRARRQFHPDAYLSAAEDLRDAVDRIARRITEAYLTLRDRNQRTAYNEGLAEGKLRCRPGSGGEGSRDVKAPPGKTAKGRRFYTLALAEERGGNLSKAVSHLKMALTFERDNPHFRSKLEELQSSLKG